MKYCGREFSNVELERIRHLAAEPKMTRMALSQQDSGTNTSIVIIIWVIKHCPVHNFAILQDLMKGF